MNFFVKWGFHEIPESIPHQDIRAEELYWIDGEGLFNRFEKYIVIQMKVWQLRLFRVVFEHILKIPNALVVISI